jgi:hypothetical protein
MRLTLADFLQSSSNSFAWPTDNIYGGNLVGMFHTVVVERFQGGNTKFVGAAKEDPKRVKRASCIAPVRRPSSSSRIPAEPKGIAAANREHIGPTFNNYESWKASCSPLGRIRLIDKVGT